MFIFNCLLITYIVVYIINHSGIIYDLSKFIYELLYKKKWNYQMLRKPFGCSVCMSFWLTLIYSLTITTIIYSLTIAVTMSILSVLIDKIIKIVLYKINKIE